MDESGLFTSMPLESEYENETTQESQDAGNIPSKDGSNMDIAESNFCTNTPIYTESIIKTFDKCSAFDENWARVLFF